MATHAGSISLIMGPMFSGKTTELQRRLRRFEVARKKSLCIKYQADTRYSEEKMSTHDKTEMSALPVSKLADVPASALVGIDVIGIDEGSFYPDIVSFCEQQANAGRDVIVASLDGDFQRNAFGDILGLVPIAEEVTKLTAVCTGCAQPAAFSRRLSAETAVEVIGGADKYIATCRRCYHDPHLLAVLAEREQEEQAAAATPASQPSSPVLAPNTNESATEEGEPKIAAAAVAGALEAAACVSVA